MFELSKWNDPPKEYRVKPIVHHWEKDYITQMDAIQDFGFGGVVTNPDIDGSPENYRKDCRDFKKIGTEKKENAVVYL